MISIGRYSPEKQLDHQIELMSKLVPAFPNLQLHLFGFGKEERFCCKVKNIANH